MIFRNIDIDYYVGEKVFAILAVSLSLLIVLSFSIKVILSVDETLFEKNGVTVFQNFLSVILFSLRSL